MLINYIEEKMSIRFCLVQNQINQNNLHPLTQKRKKRPLNLHQVNPKKERIKKQSIASQESKGYNKLTMNSHSMYSSATALQFSYNKNKVKKKEKKKESGKVGLYKWKREIYTSHEPNIARWVLDEKSFDRKSTLYTSRLHLFWLSRSLKSAFYNVSTVSGFIYLFL